MKKRRRRFYNGHSSSTEPKGGDSNEAETATHLQSIVRRRNDAGVQQCCKPSTRASSSARICTSAGMLGWLIALPLTRSKVETVVGGNGRGVIRRLMMTRPTFFTYLRHPNSYFELRTANYLSRRACGLGADRNAQPQPSCVRWAPPEMLHPICHSACLMCGRYRLSRRKQIIAEHFQTADWQDDWSPRYNIAPTQAVPVIRQHPKEPIRQISTMCWGLVPHWAKDASGAASTINARSETAATKPAFRDPLKFRRCLIPTDGFYEWKRTATGKQPFCFDVSEGELFAFAGLWDGWKNAE